MRSLTVLLHRWYMLAERRWTWPRSGPLPDASGRFESLQRRRSRHGDAANGVNREPRKLSRAPNQVAV